MAGSVTVIFLREQPMSPDAPDRSELDPRTDAWLALLLSLAFPGAGQLWKRRVSGLLWMLAAAMLLAAWELIRLNWNYRSLPLQYLSFLLLASLSAWHAARCHRPR